MSLSQDNSALYVPDKVFRTRGSVGEELYLVKADAPAPFPVGVNPAPVLPAVTLTGAQAERLLTYFRKVLYHTPDHHGDDPGLRQAAPNEPTPTWAENLLSKLLYH